MFDPRDLNDRENMAWLVLLLLVAVCLALGGLTRALWEVLI